MAARKKEPAVPEEPSEPSRTAGGCVLLGAALGAEAAVWAVSPEAGVLALWVVGGAVLWGAARRRVSDMPATPPPEGVGPCRGECPGHEAEDGTTLHHREGMSIYVTPDRANPVRTHVRVQEH